MAQQIADDSLTLNSLVSPIWDKDRDYVSFARDITDAMRSSDDWRFQNLRRALGEEGLQPDQIVVAEMFPDGGADFGLIITPGGATRTFDVSWDKETVRFASIKGNVAHGYAVKLYGGWQLFNEEGRGPKDPIDALIPIVRWGTAMFNGTDSLVEYRQRRPIDWSIPNRLLADAGADPGDTIVIPQTTTVLDDSTAFGFVFLTGDDRAYFFAAHRDSERVLGEPLAWDHLVGKQVEDVCGPLSEAAVRFRAGEGN